MGCDGYVEPGKIPNVVVTCYECGEPVGGIEDHSNCATGGRIPVIVEIENYEER